MVTSRQVEISFYRGVGQQRGRGFGAFAQVIGRTSISFLRKYVVRTAKRVGADFLQVAVPEIAEVVSGKNFKTAPKNVREDKLRKQWSSISGKRKAAKQSPSNKMYKTNQSVAKRHFYIRFSLIMSKNFWHQPLCGSFWETWRESTSS